MSIPTASARVKKEELDPPSPQPIPLNPVEHLTQLVANQEFSKILTFCQGYTAESRAEQKLLVKAAIALERADKIQIAVGILTTALPENGKKEALEEFVSLCANRNRRTNAFPAEAKTCQKIISKMRDKVYAEEIVELKQLYLELTAQVRDSNNPFLDLKKTDEREYDRTGALNLQMLIRECEVKDQFNLAFLLCQYLPQTPLENDLLPDPPEIDLLKEWPSFAQAKVCICMCAFGNEEKARAQAAKVSSEPHRQYALQEIEKASKGIDTYHYTFI